MLEFLFSQYNNYPIHEIALELIAIVFGLSSVWCAKKNNIWVFPTGMVNTAIYTYLLWKWSLLGDMMINGYYFIMSVYGWYYWTRKKEDATGFSISIITFREKMISLIIFVVTIIFVIIVYVIFDKLTTWAAYVDTFITGIFFVGMWLMAKKKIENWILWIIGDLISIPLYFIKGFTFTSFQYLIFTIIAYYGYIEWKKILNNSTPQ